MRNMVGSFQCCSSKLIALFIAVIAYIVAQALLQAPDLTQLPQSFRPYRPLPILVLNYVLENHLWFLIPSLKSDDIMYGAELITRLHDWEDEDGHLKEALNQLSNSLEEGRELTPTGRIWTRATIHIFMANRLKIIDYYKNNPKVHEENIEEPVFIIGTPRSGTSFMHNLMKLDSQRFRAPLQWEQIDPIPPTDPDKLQRFNLRGLLNEFSTYAIYLLAPSFAKAHPTSAFNAEECMPILAFDAKSLVFNTLFGAEKYQEWLNEQNMHSAFKFHKRFLQVLQSAEEGNTRKTWLLKAPWHYNHLDEILRVYPDAKIINTHRPPSGTIPSLSSLHALLYGAITNEIRPKFIGKFQWNLWKRIIPKYLSVRNQMANKNGDMIDLYFDLVVKHPLLQVEKVYKTYGWELRTDIRQKMEDYLNSSLHATGKIGKHEYKLEWFGLNETDMLETKEFQEYCRVFNMRPEFKHSKDL